MAPCRLCGRIHARIAGNRTLLLVRLSVSYMHRVQERTMEDVIGTIRTFRPPTFMVIVDALEDFDTDLSWDKDGEVLAKLESGEYVAFCARARVLHPELGELASDYLGGCIYESIEGFEDHRECGAYQRKLRA